MSREKWYLFWHWNPLTLVIGLPLIAVIVFYAVGGGGNGPIGGMSLVDTMTVESQTAVEIYLPARYAGDYDASGPKRFLGALDLEDYSSKSLEERTEYRAGQGAPEKVSSELNHFFDSMKARTPATLISEYYWTQGFQDQANSCFWVASYDVRTNTLYAIRPAPKKP